MNCHNDQLVASGWSVADTKHWVGKVREFEIPARRAGPSGHHRVEAAKKADLTRIPAWVESMSDEEAYMELVTSNAQGELLPLEIGIHALAVVEKSTGGRGKTGGLSEYAEKVGKSKSKVSEYTSAARVYQNCSHVGTVLLDKARHLSAIHALPDSVWPEAVEHLVASGMSVKDVTAAVKDSKDAATDKRVIDRLHAPHPRRRRLLLGDGFQS